MNQRLKKLINCMQQLDTDQQQCVLEFASFLAQQAKVSDIPANLEVPKSLARPAGESVVAAMKRLTETYFMLESGDLLNKASDLMGQHILQGKEAKLVIDELQIMFQVQYELYKKR